MEKEKRLIDANAIPWEEYYVPDPDSNAQWDFKKEWSVSKPVVDQMPAVDAVEVIRCKDCKHIEITPDCLRWCNVWCGINGMGDEGFCNYGERKDNV